MIKFKKIISIHGVPRSGTSWLGQIFNSSPEVRYKFQPLFSYAFKDQINIYSTKKEILDYFNRLYDYKDSFIDQVGKKKIGVYPIYNYKKKKPKYLVTKMVRYHFLIPHFLYLLNNIYIIAIVRHPCGVLNSWKKAPREFLQEWNFSKEWRFGQSKNEFRPEEYYGFHRWKEATKLFLEMSEQYPKKFKLIKYENLVRNPVSLTKELFGFVQLDFSNVTLNFLNDSTTKMHQDPYSVYKGKKDVNDWKKELDKKIVKNVFRELKGSEFEKFLI